MTFLSDLLTVMEIYCIIADQVQNNTMGVINYKAHIVGTQAWEEGFESPSTLLSIKEGHGANGKSILVLTYENGVAQEIPDYNIKKLRK